MQELRLSASSVSDGLQHGIPRSVRSLLTPRRLAYSLASALLVIGVTSMQSKAIDQRPDDATAQNLSTPASGNGEVQPQPTDTTDGLSASTTTNFSSTTINGTTHSNLTVNGQDIPLPADQAQQHTSIDDTSTTTVRTSSSNSDNTLQIDITSTAPGARAN